jgi:formyltetrahydrofolate synthetase
MSTDLEIAGAAALKPISEIATGLGIPDEAVDPYGRFKAKLSLDWLRANAGTVRGKLILVTAITPTPAPTGHIVHVREVRLAAGAGFVVAIGAELMTMPGLPRAPAAERIGFDASGNVEGLF